MDVELSFCGAKLAALPDCTDHALLGPPLTQAFGAADVLMAVVVRSQERFVKP